MAENSRGKDKGEAPGVAGAPGAPGATGQDGPLVTGRDILNIDQAAELLGVSVKTFNKVLHSENLPGRKIGREWKFSRQALIDWVGGGRSEEFYREAAGGAGKPGDKAGDKSGPRRAGWRMELD